MKKNTMQTALLLLYLGWFHPSFLQAEVSLLPVANEVGFMARLLINETPFPGEKGYVSEANSKQTMDAILAVVVNRAHRVPRPYSRKAVASVDTSDLIEIVAAGGKRGQVDGFYLDEHSKPAVVPRVEERVEYLLMVANKGTPGTFAALFTYAQEQSRKALDEHEAAKDPFALLSEIGQIPVTGYSFAWMTDAPQFNPGGNFLRIPNQSNGSLGGNRFFTLRKNPQ